MVIISKIVTFPGQLRDCANIQVLKLTPLRETNTSRLCYQNYNVIVLSLWTNSNVHHSKYILVTRHIHSNCVILRARVCFCSTFPNSLPVQRSKQLMGTNHSSLFFLSTHQGSGRNSPSPSAFQHQTTYNRLTLCPPQR